ncbi:hypothetical protein LP416_04080 [Polaromonas sp. P2-4]|nr:hypothetical protein LP416_04080 [Polaromonas sp. P2-4]
MDASIDVPPSCQGTATCHRLNSTAPMVGGMVTAPLLSMFVIPAAYWLMRRQPKGR